jgi:hypothetical protein
LTIDASAEISGYGGLSTFFNDSPHEVINNGVIAALSVGNTLDVNVSDIAGTGTLSIVGTLEIDANHVSDSGQTYASVGSGQSVQLYENSAILEIGGSEVDTSTFEAVIKGFAVGDKIDLTGIAGGNNYSFDGSVLTIESGNTVLASLLISNPATTSFAVTGDGSGGTAITLTETGPTITISGPIAGDNIINKAEAAAGVTLSGTAAVGTDGAAVNGQIATITIVDSTGATEDTLTSTVSNGTWSVNLAAAQIQGLADGTYFVEANVSDMAGNVATTATQTFTLDTTAPTIAITSAGGSTNQASQTITGTVDAADAGATVTVLDGATVVGSAVVQSNGSWTATGVTLSNGTNSLTAKVTDVAGNTATSAAVVYTLSTTAPTVTESLAIDTGSSATDHITSNDAITGSGLANTVVHFTIDGVASATTVTANAQGGWSFTPSGLADGAHTIVASQTDSFGNTGTASLSFTLDTTAPTIAITSAGGSTNQASQTITGTVDAADAGATVTVLDGTTTVGTAVVQSNGSWTATGVTLSNGSNSLTAQVTDLAGNTTTSSAVIYTLSTTAPTVTESLAFDTGSSATDHITSNDAINGNGIANTVVHFTIDGTPSATTVTANAQGAWSFTPSGLADGAHTIVASQTDSFGNTGTASLSFTLDTTAPTIAITSAGGPTNQPSQTITGTVDAADAGATVTILDGTTAVGSALVQSNGNWTATGVTLSNGTNSLTAKVTDVAGNTATSAAVVYTLSTTAPTVTESLAFDTGSSATDHITSNDAINGNGLANTVVHFTIDGVASATTVTANAQGGWSFTPSGLTDGAHTIVASQTDSFGNTGTASLSFTLDKVPPTVAITSAGGATSQSTQTIAGTVTTTEAAAVGTVVLFDTYNGVQTELGTATLSGGSWSTTVTLSGSGTHSIVAQDTDLAGNTGASSVVTYSLTVAANSWANQSGGNWTVGANWSSGSVPSSTANVTLGPIGATANYLVSIFPGTTVLANSLVLSDVWAQLVDEGTLSIAGTLSLVNGLFDIADGGTLTVGGGLSGSPNEFIEFSGTGGNLVLNGTTNQTVQLLSNANGAISVSGSGNITTTSGDALDLTSSLGTSANPANLTIGLTGAISGAANAVNVVQSGT